jgi:hypothetical protein
MDRIGTGTPMHSVSIDGLTITEEEAETLCESTLAKDAYLQVNKHLIHLCGLEASVLLADLISKHRYFRERQQLCMHNGQHGWFYNSIQDVKNNTTLSGHKQRKAIYSLVSLGLLECEEFGASQEHFQNRRYFKINFFSVVKKLYDRNSLLLKNLTTGENPIKQGESSCCQKIEQQEKIDAPCCQKIEQQEKPGFTPNNNGFQNSPVVKKFNTNNNKYKKNKKEREILQIIPGSDLDQEDLEARQKQQEHEQRQRMLARQFLKENRLDGYDILH